MKKAEALINELGGPAQVAKRLGIYPTGVARVSNWKKRGIPAHVYLQYPHIFHTYPAHEVCREVSKVNTL
ncbi:hypothetical protein [Paenalcaligenes hermetiae]